jgi:alkylation response protein AidB-like acyl-CoA dehydrogenase
MDLDSRSATQGIGDQVDFDLTPEQRTLQQTVRAFLEAKCTKEWLDDLEEREEYPYDLWSGLVELGLFGLGVPEELGGSGGGMLEIAVVCEELGRFGGSVNMTYVPTAVFGNQTLLGGASPAMRDRFLGPMAAGQLRTAFALTEPEAGSDAAALRSRAVLDGEQWVINGTKIWSSGALAADYLVLSARTGTAEARHAAITVFMVDAHAQGLTISGIPKLGHHAVKSCEVSLHDVRVPRDMVVGEVDAGWRALVRALDAERIAVAAICTGLSQKCTDLSLDYGLHRVQFGRPVASFQALSHMLADMETETAAARWLTRHAAWLTDQGRRASKEASMAKSYATELGTRSAAHGMQILGGYGYSKEFQMERFYREAKLYEVAGGSTQIQRNIIARQLGIPE